MDILIISVLIFLGLLFCVIELLILPGITIGGLLSLVSYGVAIYLAFERLGAGAGVLVIIAILGLSIIATFFSLRAKTWDRFSLKSQIESSSSESPQELLTIGQRGVAVSRLAPMGKIEVDGQSYEAKSSDSYIDAKTEVEVVGFENFSVVVKKVN